MGGGGGGGGGGGSSGSGERYAWIGIGIVCAWKNFLEKRIAAAAAIEPRLVGGQAVGAPCPKGGEGGGGSARIWSDFRDGSFGGLADAFSCGFRFRRQFESSRPITGRKRYRMTGGSTADTDGRFGASGVAERHTRVVVDVEATGGRRQGRHGGKPPPFHLALKKSNEKMKRRLLCDVRPSSVGLSEPGEACVRSVGSRHRQLANQIVPSVKSRDTHACMTVRAVTTPAVDRRAREVHVCKVLLHRDRSEARHISLAGWHSARQDTPESSQSRKLTSWRLCLLSYSIRFGAPRDYFCGKEFSCIQNRSALEHTDDDAHQQMHALINPNKKHLIISHTKLPDLSLPV